MQAYIEELAQRISVPVVNAGLAEDRFEIKFYKRCSRVALRAWVKAAHELRKAAESTTDT